MHKNKFRLHKLVSQTLKKNGIFDYSQPEIQRNIENFGVNVDGMLIFKRLDWVFPEQQLDISHWPVRPRGNLTDIRVIEENEDYLLIYKPPNLAVQPGTGHTKDNLVTWLIENFDEQKKLKNTTTKFRTERAEVVSIDSSLNNTQPKQPSYLRDGGKYVNPTAGLVHRLDKDAQGLLLVAKSLEMLNYFQDQFRKHSVIKKYLAVVQGIMAEPIEVRSWQCRDKREPIRQKLFWNEQEAKNYDEKARYAESIFTPKIQCHELNQTLVEVQINTGRMHQIRLQAETLGFPLVGDKIYGQSKASLLGVTSNSLWGGLNFYKIKMNKLIVIEISRAQFQKLKNKIFGPVEFCLLSNYLEVEYRGKVKSWRYSEL